MYINFLTSTFCLSSSCINSFLCEAVNNKWGCLRDTFRKELSKLTKKNKESTLLYNSRKENYRVMSRALMNTYYKNIEDPDVVSAPCSLDESDPSIHTRELPSR